MTKYQDLVTQKKLLEAQLIEAYTTERDDAIEQIQRMMIEYGISIDAIAEDRTVSREVVCVPEDLSGYPYGDGREPPKPKYMDPKTGKTWSGRGRAPNWIGKKPEKFLVAAG